MTIQASEGTQGEREALARQIEILLESTDEGIFITDGEGRCTLMNRAACEMLGYRPEEVLDHDTHQMLHRHLTDGSPAPAGECYLQHPAKEGRTPRRQDVFYRRDESRFPVEVFASPIRGETGDEGGMVVSFTDVTARQLQQRNLERVERLAGLGRVASTISHEFNNVLMGIQPFAEIILRQSSDERVCNGARHIVQSVQRGRRVTQEILKFTRPVEPARQFVDVRSWLEDTADELRGLLPPEVHLDLDLAAAGLGVEADREQIAQVIRNLVINAREAIGTGVGTITLATRPCAAGETHSFGVVPDSERFVHFSVADDGPGIPPAHMDHLFEPFFTTRRAGTGLGLALAHQIITLHRGHIFAESSGGSGTTLHFFLPLASRPLEHPEPRRPPERGAGPSRILLVEDEEGIAAGLVALLEADGIAVHVARNGAEAMAFLGTHRPEALVLDVGLPDIDGTVLYEQIVAKHGAIPTVFSSGHLDQARFGAALPESVRVLAKPYEIKALFAALEDVCRRGPGR